MTAKEINFAFEMIAAIAAVATVREVLTARHFEDIATAYTSATVYAVCHLEGEIYTIKIDKKATRADIEAAPMTCRRYQYCASARRIINRPDVVKCNLYRTAAALCQDLKNEELMPAIIQLANQWDYKATTANVEKAARIWSDTQRKKTTQEVRKDAETTKAKAGAKEARRAIREAAESNEAPAEGLRLVETAEGVAVVGNDWKDTYFNKRQIKAHGCTWNKERKQWEATEPEAVAMVREWFALRQEVQTAAPAPLETSSEIEEPAESLAIAASYDTSDAPAAESNAQREAAKLAEPEQRDGDQWRFVINAVGEIYANGDDLPAFLTLDEAKASNHLQDAWTNPQGEEEPATHILYEYCKIGDEGTNRIAYGQTEAQARWNYANGFFDISHAEAQKPDWLKVGTRFALVDHVTGKPTSCRYTCEAIDEERHTITVPEASDSFRNGSHEFSWLWHWNQFAPISDDPQPAEVCACYDTNDAPLQEASEMTEAEGIKIGDSVKHNGTGDIATVTGIRQEYMKAFGGVRHLFRLDFGKSILFAFDIEMNGGEYLREALTLCDPDGKEVKDFETWNGITVKAETRQKWTRLFADVIKARALADVTERYNHNAVFVTVRVAYRNGSESPEDWSYCVSWYEETDKGGVLRECENGASFWQAARAMADFHLLADMVGFATIGEILNPTEKPNYSASEKSGAPQPSAWVTDYTGDDFAKLQSRYEISDDDRDIMGRRFRLTGKDGKALLGELQVFISDYAGNERHAIYYIWDEFMNEVKCNVRPLDWLRTHFTKANGWEPIENSDTFCRHAA